MYSRSAAPPQIQYQPYQRSPRELISQIRKSRTDAEAELAANLLDARTATAARIRRISLLAKQKATKRAHSILWEELTKKLSVFDTAYQAVIKSAYQDVLNLALTVAKEVVGQECGNSAALGARIKRELETLELARKCKILVHPKQLNAVKAETSRLGIDTPLATSEAVLLGNAIILTPSGKVELNLLDHFASISSSLSESINNLSNGVTNR